MKKIVFISVILIGILFNFSFLKEGVSKYEISTQNKKTNKKIEKDENTDVNIEKFETIKIGDNKEHVLSIIGEPNRIDDSEYDFKWYVYNQHKEKFVMVGIENDTVVGLYSNYINSCEIDKIHINDTNENVVNNYDILKYKKKGNTRYIINSKNQYDIIKQDNKYITFFL